MERARKLSRFFVPRHLTFLALNGALSGPSETTKIKHMEPILFVLDAQNTSDKNGCQTRHEEESKDTVVPHLL